MLERVSKAGENIPAEARIQAGEASVYQSDAADADRQESGGELSPTILGASSYPRPRGFLR